MGGMKQCKICGLEKYYAPEAMGSAARGFHGSVCWSCFLAEQKGWRATGLGREANNDSSRLSKRKAAGTRIEEPKGGHVEPKL